MGEGLSVNKSWTVQVPTSGRTVSQNLWQYSIFPNATAPSIMYPCDGLSNYNDKALMGFDFDTTNFLDTSTNMIYQLMPMMKQWLAQQAQIYQKTMENISGNTTINIKKTAQDDINGEIDGKSAIKEDAINQTINKMASDPKTADRMNREITFTDKDGKEQKTTLLRRLIALSKEYQENPDRPEIVEISQENYELLWDIAGKYAETGELSREDYAKLIEIATNPGGLGAHGKVDPEKGSKGTRPAKNQAVLDAAEAGSPNNYKQLADDAAKAMYRLGTDTELLDKVKLQTNKNNVVEISNYFYEAHGENEGENIIDAIFADCQSWGKGNHWYTDDDPKPYVTRFSNALIERTEDLIKNNPNMNDEDVKALKQACAELKTSIDDKNIKKGSILTGNISSECAKGISQKYQALLDKLTKMEKSIYSED